MASESDLDIVKSLKNNDKIEKIEIIDLDKEFLDKHKDILEKFNSVLDKG